MSALVVCLLCDRQRELFRPYNGMVCSNCGARSPKVVRDRRIWMDWGAKDGLAQDEVMRRVYAGLKWLQLHRAYKDKWALARYRSIFGTWPPREIDGIEPDLPQAGLLKRIALDNAKWKKAKRAEEKVMPAPSPAVAPLAESALMTSDDWGVSL